MSTSSAEPDPQQKRASDSDRESAAETLRQAAGDGRLTMDELDQRLEAVYAAKTYAELVPITNDLPDSAAAGAAAAAAGAAGAAAGQAATPSAEVRQYGGDGTSSSAIAIFGGFSRKGDWVVPKSFKAFMLMGGGEIDMRDARFAASEVSIHVVAIMGGCEIIVPEDATVHVTGVGIMGAFEHSVAGAGVPGGPVIHVSGLALMGGVNVKRKPKT